MVTINVFERRPGYRPSATFAADKAGKELKAKHPDTILFTLGELDISPTNAFLDHLKRDIAGKGGIYKLAKEAGDGSTQDTGPGTGYPLSQGTPELRAVAAHTFHKETLIDNITADDVVVSAGGKAVLTAIGSTYNAGDEVIVAGPGWPTNYEFWPIGTKIIEVDTNGRGLMTAEELQETLARHPHAKAILINDPCNPTGARYTPEEREAVMKVINDAREGSHKNLMAVVDDPYGALTYNGATMVRGKEETKLFVEGGEVVANSVSKVYARPDLRVGYAVTKNKDLIKGMLNYIQTVGASISVDAQNKAQLLLLFGDPFKEATRKRLEARSELLTNAINSIRVNDEQMLSMQKPQGAIYGWVNCEKLEGASYKGSDGKMHTISKPGDVAEFMRDMAHVAPVDGSPFYEERSPAASKAWYVRVLLTDEKILQEACTRLESALKTLTTRMPHRSAGAMAVGQN